MRFPCYNNGMNKRCQKPGCNNLVPKEAYKKLCHDCYWKQLHPEDILNPYNVAEHFKIKALELNIILNELGWVERAGKGWKPTALGVSMKALYKGMSPGDKSYVNWPKSILQNHMLQKAVSDYLGNSLSTDSSIQEFRQKYPAGFRTMDGHMVRSRGEALIDNYLYHARLVHVYERKLPVEEEIYCDFYLPNNKVYIEYWGGENDEKYTERRKKKKRIYQKYKDKFNLIELGDNEIANLDDHLPRLLLKFDIAVD